MFQRFHGSRVFLCASMSLWVLAGADHSLSAPNPSGPASMGALPEGKGDWNRAEYVFTGKLDGVQAGPVGQSMPPHYTHTLALAVEKSLRGGLKPGQRVEVAHVARQIEEPTFPVGETCLVAAAKVRNALQATRVEAADPDTVAAVTTLVGAVPLGWEVKQGKPVSPWARIKSYKWLGEPGLQADHRCSVTGRPALFAGEGVAFAVEPVPPAKEIQWTNPDGDGEYKITVTNTTNRPLRVAALLGDSQRILWEESLVLISQGKAYPAPKAGRMTEPVKGVELKPGESVSGVVNIFAVEGPEWPQGGDRIEFQFCLGEKSQTKSFYYLARHHDALRERARER
ncbi:MAG: hypothetical protein ACOY3P_18980 [Planctomycetota bacterium]